MRMTRREAPQAAPRAPQCRCCRGSATAPCADQRHHPRAGEQHRRLRPATLAVRPRVARPRPLLHEGGSHSFRAPPSLSPDPRLAPATSLLGLAWASIAFLLLNVRPAPHSRVPPPSRAPRALTPGRRFSRCAVHLPSLGRVHLHAERAGVPCVPPSPPASLHSSRPQPAHASLPASAHKRAVDPQTR